MNLHFNIIKNDYFKTYDNRIFKVINVWFKAGKPCDIDFIEIKQEPEVVDLISKPYNIIKELVINKKIILI